MTKEHVKKEKIDNKLDFIKIKSFWAQRIPPRKYKYNLQNGRQFSKPDKYNLLKVSIKNQVFGIYIKNFTTQK